LCRWLVDVLKLDVVPTDERILGFSNRWYRPAMDTAEEKELEPELRIRVVTAPYFVATKLEAFRGRGHSDYTSSHDLEDLLTVIDGRQTIVEEITAANELRAYIVEEFRALLGTPSFVEGLSGYLLPDAGSQGRLPILLARITEIAK
jgi:hypothetical protein